MSFRSAKGRGVSGSWRVSFQVISPSIPAFEDEIICVDVRKCYALDQLMVRMSISYRHYPTHPVVRPGALLVANCHGDAGAKGCAFFAKSLRQDSCWNRMDCIMHEALNLNERCLPSL